MFNSHQQAVSWRQLTKQVDRQTATRIKNSQDPFILMRLLEAAGGNIRELTDSIARQVVFVSENDSNRDRIAAAYRQRYGD